MEKLPPGAAFFFIVIDFDDCEADISIPVFGERSINFAETGYRSGKCFNESNKQLTEKICFMDGL